MEKMFIEWAKNELKLQAFSFQIEKVLECWIESMESGFMTLKDAIEILKDCEDESAKTSLERFLYKGLSKGKKKGA